MQRNAERKSSSLNTIEQATETVSARSSSVANQEASPFSKAQILSWSAWGLACVSLAFSLTTARELSRSVTPGLIRDFQTPFAIVALLLFALACRPVLTSVFAVVGFLGYAFAYSIFSHTWLLLAYAAGMGMASWLAAQYSLSAFAPQRAEAVQAGARLGAGARIAAVDRFGPRSPRLLLAAFAFPLSIFLHTFCLLGLNSLSVTSLLLWGAGWLGFWIALQHQALIADWNTFRAWLRTVSLESSIDSFLSAALVLVGLVSAFLYLVPEALCFDCDKAYLAFAKFYVRENSLFLTEPAIVRDGMRSFPHLEEIYFAAGYLLSGSLGAKILAWTLVVAKLYAFYFVATTTAGLSRATAKLLVLSYALCPIVVELHAIERPENALSLTALILFYALEGARAERIAGRSHRAIRFVVLAVVAASVAASLKYTAFFLLAALAVVYWDVGLFAIRSIFRILRQHAPLVLGSALIAGFWYARNLMQWGELVSYVPFEKYHLTILFPPLRSLDELGTFLQTGFLLTANYTEFPNFGYGIWGVVLVGGLIAALTRPGPTRRASLIVLLFGIGLLISSRQIRYFGAVAPLGLMALFGLVHSLRSGKNAVLSNRWKEAWLVGFVLLQAAIAVAVNHDTLVGSSVRKQLALPDRDLSRVGGSYAPVNQRVSYPKTIMTSAFDANANIDAKLMRVDPVWTFAQLRKVIEQVRPPYYLLSQPGQYIHDFPFFNDADFFAAIADRDVQDGQLHLFRANHAKFDRVADYIATQGWPEHSTIVVSEGLKQKFPHEIILGDELRIPGLPHRLYRLAGSWWSGGVYRSFDNTETFLSGRTLARYFEDVPSATTPHSSLLATTRVEQRTKSGPHPFQPATPLSEQAQPGVSGFIAYQFELPQSLRKEAAVIEVYGRLATSANGVEMRLFGTTVSLPAVQSLDAWYPLGEVALTPALVRAGKLTARFELKSADARFRDLRIWIRQPHQRLSKLYVAPEFVEQGVRLDLAAPVLSVVEDFRSSLKASPGLNYRTERDNVTIGSHSTEESSMIQLDPKLPGKKVYRIVLPAELSKNVVAKVFLAGATEGKGNGITLRIRSIHGRGGQLGKKVVEPVVFEGRFSEWREPNAARLIAEQYFSTLLDRPDGVSDLEIEVELSSRVSEPVKPFVSNLVVVLGKAHIQEIPVLEPLLLPQGSLKPKKPRTRS